MNTEIQLSDLTNGLNGNGAFDVLMQTMSEHLLEEFTKSRITGVNYANVYLGSMTAVLQQSIDFLLRKDLVAAQIDLTTAQIANTEADTAVKEKNLLLIDAQIAIANKDIELKTAQVAIALKEVELKEKELEIAAQQLIKIEKEVELIGAQIVKTDSEIALINAKTATEQAQTNDVNTGIVGAQKKLYEAQTTGFSNDHQYKMTKLNSDIYSVMLSQDPDAEWAAPPSWIYNYS